VTDANLVLGRLSAEHFPKIFGPNENEPLDLDSTRKTFEGLTKTINFDLEISGGKLLTVEEVCLGFLNVANESMCRPIRQVTESKGFNTSDHNLASFGGAGGQHACVRIHVKFYNAPTDKHRQSRIDSASNVSWFTDTLPY
jgi:5-oxoprolinase (ATP-hydrolysing)